MVHRCEWLGGWGIYRTFMKPCWYRSFLGAGFDPVVMTAVSILVSWRMWSLNMFEQMIVKINEIVGMCIRTSSTTLCLNHTICTPVRITVRALLLPHFNSMSSSLIRSRLWHISSSNEPIFEIGCYAELGLVHFLQSYRISFCHFAIDPWCNVKW